MAKKAVKKVTKLKVKPKAKIKKVKIIPDLREDVREAMEFFAKQGKIVIIDVFGDYTLFCQKVDKLVLFQSNQTGFQPYERTDSETFHGPFILKYSHPARHKEDCPHLIKSLIDFGVKLYNIDSPKMLHHVLNDIHTGA
jgi:hypothetical protein